MLLRPDDAPRDGSYHCPDCGGRILLRAGAKVVRHFAHYEPPEACRLTGEGARHVVAKHVSAEKRGVLLDAGLRWVEVSVGQVLDEDGRVLRPLAGGGFRIWRRCHRCKVERVRRLEAESRRRECRAIVTRIFGEPRFSKGVGRGQTRAGPRVDERPAARSGAVVGCVALGGAGKSFLGGGSRFRYDV